MRRKALTVNSLTENCKKRKKIPAHNNNKYLPEVDWPPRAKSGIFFLLLLLVFPKGVASLIDTQGVSVGRYNNQSAIDSQNRPRIAYPRPSGDAEGGLDTGGGACAARLVQVG